MTQGIEGGVGLTEHLRQSIGYHLRSASIRVYDTTGIWVDKTLPETIPGIIIRPPKTTYRGVPEIDLRDTEVNHPYLTWFMRQGGPISERMYGGGEIDPTFWEINVRMGENTIFQYDTCADWLRSFLEQRNEFDVFFFTYTGGSPPVTRGDIIAHGIVSDVIEADRQDISFARGDDGWIVVNFTVEIIKAIPLR